MSNRSSSITTTTTTTRQSKTKFSNLFGRSLSNNKCNNIEHYFASSNINIDSLKRAKSVTKVEGEKVHQRSLITKNNEESLL